jgi:hypothetical protein
MSSPVQDDADKQLMRALPWVSDPRRPDEARRLEEDVVAAAQRLLDAGLQASHTRTQLTQQRADVGLRAEARPGEEKRSLEEITARVLAALKPELMPPSLRAETRLPGFGWIAGLAGAVGVAAAVALLAANVVRIPINASVSSEDETVRSQSVSTAVLAKLPQIEAAQASVQPAEAPWAPTTPLLATSQTPATTQTLASTQSLASTQTNAVTVATPSVPAPPTSPQIAPVQPDTKTPPAAAVPEPRPAVSLTRDEIASMLKRGQDLIAAGDVASGRLMLTHLAEAGDAQAAFILAGTFDAAVLASLRVVGVQPDPAKARAWYQRAAEQGSLEAKQRLQQSALR